MTIATAAPTAPVAPSATSATNEPAIFDHLAAPETPAAPEPKIDPPLGEASTQEQPKPLAAAAVPETETKPPVEEPVKPAAVPAVAVPVTPAPLKLWDGREMKPEDVVIAYKRSSQEGQRLAQSLKESDKAVKDLKAKLGELELQLVLGPEMKELTKDELEALSPNAVAEYHTKRIERKMIAERLKERKEAEERQLAEKSAALQEAIIARADAMEQDAKNFPDYKALEPIMDELMEIAPWVRGRQFTPEILYYAAYGHRALQLATQSRAAEDKAKADAAAKAAADAARGAAPGVSSLPTTTPAGQTTVNPDSDEAHNKVLIDAWRRNAGSVFQ